MIAGKRGSPLCCVGWRAAAEAGSRLWVNCLRVRTGDPQGDDLVVVRYPKGIRHLIKAVGGRTTRIISTQTQHDLGLTCTRQAHTSFWKKASTAAGCIVSCCLHTTIQRRAVSVGALWARQPECLRCPAATRRVARAPFTSNTPAVTRHRRNPTDQTSSRSRLICASPATFKTEEWRRTAVQTEPSLTYQMPISSTSPDLTSAATGSSRPVPPHHRP